MSVVFAANDWAHLMKFGLMRGAPGKASLPGPLAVYILYLVVIGFGGNGAARSLSSSCTLWTTYSSVFTLQYILSIDPSSGATSIVYNFSKDAKALWTLMPQAALFDSANSGIAFTYMLPVDYNPSGFAGYMGTLSSALDLTSSALTSAAVNVSFQPWALHQDETSGLLYGLYFNQTNQQVVSIDPETAMLTVIATLVLSDLSGEISATAYSQALRYYFLVSPASSYEGTEDWLYTVDTTTGKVVNQVQLAESVLEQAIAILYDDTKDRLLLLTESLAAHNLYVVNYTTGALLLITSITINQQLQSMLLSAWDPNTRLWYHLFQVETPTVNPTTALPEGMHSIGLATNEVIGVIDVDTGNFVISSPIVLPSVPSGGGFQSLVCVFLDGLR